MTEDAHRLADFLHAEYGRLIAYARRRWSDAGAGEPQDLVQEVAATLLARIDFVAPIENLAAYVYTALRHRLADRFRRRRAVLSLDAPLAAGGERRLADTVADPQPAAWQQAERREFAARVRAALDGLSELERAVVLATELEGRSFRELSQAWREPIGTLLARKSRALHKVRQALDAENPVAGGSHE